MKKLLKELEEEQQKLEKESTLLEAKYIMFGDSEELLAEALKLGERIELLMQKLSIVGLAMLIITEDPGEEKA